MAITTIAEQDDATLYARAAKLLAERIGATIAMQGHCALGIVGGRSVPTLLSHLVPHARQLKGRIEVFWLDERVETDKNYVDAVPYLERIREGGVNMGWHPFKSTDHDAIKGEARIALTELIKLSVGPKLDIIIVSAGEDGHVAGLFPGQETIGIAVPGYVVIHSAPKPPPVRITATGPLLLSASEALLFFVGEKRQAYEAFTDPHIPAEDCPVKLIGRIPTVTVFASLT